MDYSIKDLLKGAQVISKSVFGRKDEYELQFNHEADGCWYVDFPGWPFSHHNLMMVAGADKLCAFLSDDDIHACVKVIPANKEEDHPGYAKLVQKEHSLTGGSTYQVTGLEGFERDIWLCPVTLFVLGQYPKYIYVKKADGGCGPTGSDDIWDASLESISENERIRYRIAEYTDHLELGDTYSSRDIFGENMTFNEYYAFMEFQTMVFGIRPFDSREEFEDAISEVEGATDPNSKEGKTTLMNNIASTYFVGIEGVTDQDFTEALRWFEMSAAFNDAHALVMIGSMYYHGQGVQKNYRKAMEYYKKAIVTSAHQDALLNLGLAYLDGEGVPKNESHAFSLMLRSARQGKGAARFNMAHFYAAGIGVERNQEEALRWLRLSVASGYEEAIPYLRYYEERRNDMVQ